MIDLRRKNLPDCIDASGKIYKLNTDFRCWLDFGEIIKSKSYNISDLCFVIIDDITALDIIRYGESILEGLVNFYSNPNVTPHNTDSSNDVIIDYILDGEYIVASFMQAYGIDLTTCDMHWHLFKALLLGLPDSCKMSQIMSMRSWRKSTVSYDEQSRRLKEYWRLPVTQNNRDNELMEEINKEFYNC